MYLIRTWSWYCFYICTCIVLQLFEEFHWGGENEILCLAKHYCVEVAVVCCESMQGGPFRSYTDIQMD